MTVRPSFSHLKLLLGVLSLLCWLQPALNAIQPPDAADNPDSTQQATELKGVSAAELTAFTDSLAAKGLWLTELSTRMSRGNQVFDARAAPNTAELAWFAPVGASHTVYFVSNSVKVPRIGQSVVIDVIDMVPAK